ncbi:MAG: methionine--tRNA ligase, partial [Chloroflexi bacterium]|nr:methionine--tRNA ligase [Chloroflexota bacterium]
LARDANRYLDAQAPWHQVHEDMPAAGRTLYVALCALAALDVVLYPFLPFSAQRLHELLGRAGRVEDEPWQAVWPEPGTALPKPAPLFTKLDDAVAEEMTAKLGTSGGEAASPS